MLKLGRNDENSEKVAYPTEQAASKVSVIQKWVRHIRKSLIYSVFEILLIHILAVEGLQS